MTAAAAAALAASKSDVTFFLFCLLGICPISTERRTATRHWSTVVWLTYSGVCGRCRRLPVSQIDANAHLRQFDLQFELQTATPQFEFWSIECIDRPIADHYVVRYIVACDIWWISRRMSFSCWYLDYIIWIIFQLNWSRVKWKQPDNRLCWQEILLMKSILRKYSDHKSINF